MASRDATDVATTDAVSLTVLLEYGTRRGFHNSSAERLLPEACEGGEQRVCFLDMDTVSSGKRSWTMAQVKGHNTRPERIVRSLLHHMGYRFRLHRKDLPGKPDIVLPKFRTVIFVHGCFWHRHLGCKRASTPSSNTAYWEQKFEKNVARDAQNQAKLMSEGWRVLVIWECELKDMGGVQSRLLNFFNKRRTDGE